MFLSLYIIFLKNIFFKNYPNLGSLFSVPAHVRILEFNHQSIETFNFQDDALSVLTDRSESGASAPSSARATSPYNQSSSFSSAGNRNRDNCIGRICIGANVRGEKERGHWMSVMSNPRKVFTMWQTLY